MGVSDNRQIKWVDGLRGIASVSVMTTHLARAYDYPLFWPRDNENVPPRMIQLPVIRILWHGRLGVAIFAFLTGYVCALKPIAQMKEGNPERALTTVAKSAFRRTPRLVLPTILITTIAWLLCQLGAFEVARHTDSYYISHSSPERSTNITTAIFDLERNLISTWTTGFDTYDDHQWTMLPLLRGSMIVFILLSATAYLQNRYRLMVASAFYVYYYVSGDDFSIGFGLQLMFGFIFASFANNSSSSPQQAHISLNNPTQVLLRILLPAILLPFGLLLASFPGENYQYSNWSINLMILSTYIFPRSIENIPKCFTALGLNMCVIAIHLSPHLKRLLSCRLLLWLGKHSFAVYLVHGTILRTLLTMALYGWRVPVPPIFTDTDGVPLGDDHDGIMRNEFGDPIPPEPLHMIGGVAHNTFWVTLFFVLVYYCANLWVTYVDSYCANLTKRLEDYVFEEGEKSSGPLLS